MIQLESLRAGYPARSVLEDVTLTFGPGELTVLAGPNGCGKSTFLRTILGLQPRLGGGIWLDGQALERLTPRQRARRISYLAQSRNVPDINARRMVLHGRFPYLDYPRRYRPEDQLAVRRALEQVDALELAERPMAELSGGQRQRIYFAMVLAQDTQNVLLDEPTAYLDVSCQLEVMALARRMADEGRTVVLVLHDLCLALRAADRLVVFAEGRLQADGPPEKLCADGVLERVFGVTVRRVQTASGWRYYYA